MPSVFLINRKTTLDLALLPLFGHTRRRPKRRRRRSVVVPVVVAVLVGGFDRGRLLRFVVVRVVPRLPRAGREQVVEGRREEVHAGRDQEHDPPLRDRGLKKSESEQELANHLSRPR